MRSTPAAGAVLGLALVAAGARVDRPPTYADVAPIFAARCVVCHSGDHAPRGLRLDSYEHVRHGSERGPVVHAGEPGRSELVRRVRGESLPRMPLTGPPFLSEGEIQRLEAWIEGGLARGAAAPTPAPPPLPPLPAPGQPVTWTHVAPILTRRCVKCHTADGLRGPPPEGLILSTREQVLSRAERVRVVPGVPDASELVRRIRGQARPRMPFDGPPFLSDEETRVIVDWIAGGAQDESGSPAPIPAGARVRLHGALSARWALDGLPLRVDERTRLDESPAVGSYVRVRGVVEADGGVRALRIRTR